MISLRFPFSRIVTTDANGASSYRHRDMEKHCRFLLIAIRYPWLSCFKLNFSLFNTLFRCSISNISQNRCAHKMYQIPLKCTREISTSGLHSCAISLTDRVFSQQIFDWSLLHNVLYLRSFQLPTNAVPRHENKQICCELCVTWRCSTFDCLSLISRAHIIFANTKQTYFHFQLKVVQPDNRRNKSFTTRITIAGKFFISIFESRCLGSGNVQQVVRLHFNLLGQLWFIFRWRLFQLHWVSCWNRFVRHCAKVSCYVAPFSLTIHNHRRFFYQWF